jgi:cell division protein ZapA (FtsZ GTPase activity inhibitor)
MQKRQMRRHQIELAGRHITIQSDQPKELLSEICTYVNSRHDELTSTPGLTQTQISMLLALSIAEDLFQERANAADTINRASTETAGLLKKLEKLSSEARA